MGGSWTLSCRTEKTCGLYRRVCEGRGRALEALTGESQVDQRSHLTLLTALSGARDAGRRDAIRDRPGRCSGRWPHDSMVRSPAAPLPIPFS